MRIIRGHSSRSTLGIHLDRRRLHSGGGSFSRPPSGGGHQGGLTSLPIIIKLI